MKTKKLYLIGLIALMAIVLASCDPEARIKLINQDIEVIVDSPELKYFEKGDTVPLVYSKYPDSWEVCRNSLYERDTTIYPNSESAQYKRYAKGILVKKHRE